MAYKNPAYVRGNGGFVLEHNVVMWKFLSGTLFSSRKCRRPGGYRFCKTEKGKIWLAYYRNLPERKAYQKRMNASPHIQAQKREWNNRPENKRRAKFRQLLRYNGMSIKEYINLGADSQKR